MVWLVFRGLFIGLVDARSMAFCGPWLTAAARTL